jgi:hypothetical protein
LNDPANTNTHDTRSNRTHDHHFRALTSSIASYGRKPTHDATKKRKAGF